MSDYVGLVDRDRYPEAASLTDTALEDASAAVLNFTDRDFLSAQVVETRTFEPGNDLNPAGELIIDIDDCDEIYDVGGLSSGQWRAGTDGPAGSYGIFTYVEVRLLRPASMLMGFTRNADVFGEPFWTSVDVSARWGWPSDVVPEDIQRATLITAYAMEGDVTNLAGNLESKTVAEVSERYVVGGQFGQLNPETLPSRAITLADPWRRKTL